MAKGDVSFYAGSDNGLDPYYGEFVGDSYRAPVSSFGIATDARTANQIKVASEKISSGAKAIEVGAIQPNVAEAIPKGHMREIRRLKKLVGVDLSMHGALVEPTGVSQQGWSETDREAAERQLINNMDQAHELGGGTVVTFHASNGLPDPETKFFNPKTKKEELKSFWVVDERTGRFQNIASEKSFLEETEKKDKPIKEIIKEKLEKENEDIWFKSLQHINFNVHSGANYVGGLKHMEDLSEGASKNIKEKDVYGLYKDYTEGKSDELKNVFKKLDEKDRNVLQTTLGEIEHGDIYLREAYGEFRNLFDQAYDAAKRKGDEESIKKLKEYRERLQPKIKEFRKDSSKVKEFSKELLEGVHVLRSVNAPTILTPLKNFAIEKGGKTFSNVAYESYKKAKKLGQDAPVIAIENPPTGMGISRAEDMKEMIDAAQNQLSERFVKEDKMSKSEADKEAEKLIGATWDVGHINMLRKYGYGVEELKKQTKTIAPYVKKVHLSDNFGMEHTELPMGMGNVPKEHFEILRKNVKGYEKQVKKIVEAGDWYQHFQVTPFRQTLQAFGSPVYGMKMTPYWNQTPIFSGGYFGGRGMNPEIHHSTYGAGYSNLPLELGGQMAGKSRVSGAPIE